MLARVPAIDDRPAQRRARRTGPAAGAPRRAPEQVGGGLRTHAGIGGRHHQRRRLARGGAHRQRRQGRRHRLLRRHTPSGTSAEMGPAPVANVTARCIAEGADCSREFFDGIDGGGDNHGPAVVEIVKDMAPGTQIYIGRASTESDYYALVDWFAAQGVRVISRSLGSRYDGPGDGRGALDGVADHAVDLGITWVNSGGNNAINRYYRRPVRLIGTSVAFGAAGSDTWLRFNGCIAPGGVRWANDWDTPPGQRTDYDVFLYHSPIGNPSTERPRRLGDRRPGGPARRRSRSSRAAPARRPATRSTCGSSTSRAIPSGDVIEILDYGDGMAKFVQAPVLGRHVDRRLRATPAWSRSVRSIPRARDRSAPTARRARPTTGGSSPTCRPCRASTARRSAPGSRAPARRRRSSPAVRRCCSAPTSRSAPASSATCCATSVVDRGPTRPRQLLRHRRVPSPAAAGDDRLEPAVEVRAARLADADPRHPAVRADRPAESRRHARGRARSSTSRSPASAGIPASGVTAVAINLTLVGAARTGYGQALPTLAAPVGAFSSFNLDAAPQTRPNFAIVPIGQGGSISVYSNTGGNAIIDVLGYFTAAGGAADRWPVRRSRHVHSACSTRAATATASR